MTRTLVLTDEARQALGLAVDVVPTGDEFAELPLGRPEGSFRGVAAGLLQLVSMLGRPTIVGLSGAESRGYQVALYGTEVIEVFYSRGRVLDVRYVSQTGLHLEVEVEPGDGVTRVLARIEPGAYLYLGVSATDADVFTMSDATERGELGHAVLKGTDIDVTLIELAGVVRDQWLSRELRERATEADEWTRAAGVGLAARLSPANPTTADHDSVALAGPVYRWARNLTTVEMTLLRRLALVKMGRLRDDLEGLWDEFVPSDSSWWLRMRQACRLREELEGVAMVASQGSAFDGLGDLLDEIDESANSEHGFHRSGSSVLHGLAAFFPDPSSPNDPILQRVAVVDPTAWWGIRRVSADFVAHS